MYAANPYIRPLGLQGMGDWLTDAITADDASQSDPSSSTSFFTDPIFAPSSTPVAIAASPSSSSGFSLDSIFGDVSKIVGTGAQLYQTKTLLDINATRAKQGLPPISASAIAPTVNFGLDPAMMPYLLGGAALLLVVMMGGGKK